MLKKSQTLVWRLFNSSNCWAKKLFRGHKLVWTITWLTTLLQAQLAFLRASYVPIEQPSRNAWQWKDILNMCKLTFIWAFYRLLILLKGLSYGQCYISEVMLSTVNSQSLKSRRISPEPSRPSCQWCQDFWISFTHCAKESLKNKKATLKWKDYSEEKREWWLLEAHLFLLKFYRSSETLWNATLGKDMAKQKQQQPHS